MTTFRTIYREVALKNRVTKSVIISEEMYAEAQKLALKARQIVEERGLHDIFPTTVEQRKGGYLGQMAFHQWFSNDWRKAVKYIGKELEQMATGHKIDVVDGEINSATIDVKETDLTLPRTYLAFDPGYPFGLQVPETQFTRKQYDAYVLVILLPPEMVKRYGHEADIFGYALKEEVAKTEPQEYKRHRTLNRSIHYRELHPMFLFTPEFWNSDIAKRTSIGNIGELTEEKKDLILRT